MLSTLIKTIQSQYSGLAARDHVARIARHHRIQASPGFRAAAHEVKDMLDTLGIGGELLIVPAQEGIQYWGQQGFQEWEVRRATLHLVEPADAATRLCDFREVKLSLIQRSAPTPPVEAEVVLLEDGTTPQEYAALDVKGKIVLTNGAVNRVRELAVEQRSALGILFDGMRANPPTRPLMDLPDARQYTSFWWRGGEKRCFGFVLSPRQGAMLRQLIRQRAMDGKPPVRVRAAVDSRLYDGAMEIVSARIPGETAEEIVVVAHLCHPEPSANDNASGCGAALEAAATLHALIQQGKLPRPRRTIRFFWLPEMTGTYAYLATHEDEIPRLVAGINLDMVGEDQDQCGSVWLVEYPPESLPSYVGDLMAAIQETLADGVSNFAGNQRFSAFRHATSRFSGGSDHYILSDPTVGVPTPMLIQWPDRFYHTSEDTIDKVSPAMLAHVGVATAAYAYFLASAALPEAKWLAQEMLTRRKATLARHTQELINAALAATDAAALDLVRQRLQRKSDYWAAWQREALASLQRLSPEADAVIARAQMLAAQTLAAELQRAEDVINEQARTLGTHTSGAPSSPPDEWEAQAARLVPIRVYRGPVSVGSYLWRLDETRREEAHRWLEAHEAMQTSATLALYWADGQRSVAQIADLVEMESDSRDIEYLVRYFRLLEAVGLVRMAS